MAWGSSDRHKAASSLVISNLVHRPTAIPLLEQTETLPRARLYFSKTSLPVGTEFETDDPALLD